jgi:hypothetical protein
MVSLCLLGMPGYRAGAAEDGGFRAIAAIVSDPNDTWSGKRFANPLNSAPCSSGSSEFIASWQDKKFSAPCRFIHETVAHLRAVSALSATGFGVPLRSDHVHLAVPAALWQAKYHRFPRDEVLSAVLREPGLVAVYHATDDLAADSGQAEGSPRRPQSYNNRQVLGHYDGQGVEVLPNQVNALAQRYRSVAWFYFLPRSIDGRTPSFRNETIAFDISFDPDLAAPCSSSDRTDSRMVRVNNDEVDGD